MTPQEAMEAQRQRQQARNLSRREEVLADQRVRQGPIEDVEMAELQSDSAAEASDSDAWHPSTDARGDYRDSSVESGPRAAKSPRQPRAAAQLAQRRLAEQRAEHARVGHRLDEMEEGFEQTSTGAWRPVGPPRRPGASPSVHSVHDIRSRSPEFESERRCST